MNDYMKEMQIMAHYIQAIIYETSKAHCDFAVMDDYIRQVLSVNQLTVDNNGNKILNGEQYMVITCNNGYNYYINVSCDSPLTACAQVFGFVQYKL